MREWCAWLVSHWGAAAFLLKPAYSNQSRHCCRTKPAEKTVVRLGSTTSAFRYISAAMLKKTASCLFPLCLCLALQCPGRLFSTSYPSLPQWRMPNWLRSSSVSVTHQQGKRPFASKQLFNSVERRVCVLVNIWVFSVTAYQNHHL